MLVSGEFVKAGMRDHHEAIRRMVELGLTDGQIAFRLRRRRRSVSRTRNLLGVPPAVPRNVSNGRDAYIKIQASTVPDK